MMNCCVLKGLWAVFLLVNFFGGESAMAAADPVEGAAMQHNEVVATILQAAVDSLRGLPDKVAGAVNKEMAGLNGKVDNLSGNVNALIGTFLAHVNVLPGWKKWGKRILICGTLVASGVGLWYLYRFHNELISSTVGLQKENEFLASELKKRNEDFSNSQNKCKTDRNDFQEKNNNLLANLESCNSLNSECEAVRKLTEEALNETINEVNKANGQLEICSKEKVGVRAEHELLNKKYADLAEKNAKYKSRITEYIETIAQNTEKIENIKNEKQTLIGEKQSLIGEKQTLIGEKQTLIGEKQSLEGEKLSLIDDKQSLIDEKQSLINEKQSLIDEKQSLIDEKQSLIDQNENLKDELSKSRNDASMCQDNLSKLNADKVQYGETLKNITTAFNKLKQRVGESWWCSGFLKGIPEELGNEL
jgi:hypothetical protein